MNQAHELVEKLVALRTFPQNADLDAFHQIIVQLAEYPRDSALLRRALSAFSDAEDYGVMWTLVHYVESFPHLDYVSTLVDVTPQLDSERWLDTLYVRILNNDDTRACLKAKLITTSEANRNAVRKILSAMLADIDNEAQKKGLIAKVEFVLSSTDA